MNKLLLFLMFLAGLANAEVKTMGVVQYGTNRSVKVCAVYPTLGMACGTGLLLGKGKVLTENHIIDTLSVNGVIISSTGFKPLYLEESPLKVLVLRQDEQEFVPAIVIATHSFKDLALLRIEDDVTPSVIFDFEFYRGEEVFAIGNPSSGDFVPVKTKIVGVYLYKDGKELRNLVMIDAQDNKIRPGFSGGGIFNKNGGLVGVVEVCNESEKVCAGISSKYIQNWLNSLKGVK